MRVDVQPFQAMEIAASSPRDLPRFLAGLDDATVEAVRYVADLVVRATTAAQMSRKFTALWMECGKRRPAWPTDTSTLMADTVAAATEGMVAAGMPLGAAPAPAPLAGPVAPPESVAAPTMVVPPASHQPPVDTAADVADVPYREDIAQ